ncbi:unnamed protein product, partial [Coregonus sp. 'balchen']
LTFRHQESHRLYLQKLDEVSKLQSNCSSSIARQRSRLKDMSQLVKKCNKERLTEEDVKTLDEIKEHIKARPNTFFEMEAFLPKKNGLYLNLVLGNVSVTLLSEQSKFGYKDEYEKFKLYLTVLLLLFSFMCYFFVSYRFVDANLNFLLDQRLVGFPPLRLSLSVWSHADMVSMCGISFLILFMGNFLTTVAVVRTKLKS